MNLTLPGVGTEIGPNYANEINNDFSILDGHNHSVGNGVLITPAGLNISTDLSFVNNNATVLRSVRMTSQSGALYGASDLGCIYNNAGDLYYNDGSGNQIAMTASGGIAGSPGSIANLVSPASATYTAASETFTWAAGTSGKAAAMDNGSVTIRQNNTASANGITLASPNSLANAYSLTLPTALPGSTQYLSCDSSGNLGTVTGDAIGQVMTSVGSNAISVVRTRATGSSVGAGGVAISSSCGNFLTTTMSPTFVAVTNLSVTLVTSGRPVFIGLIPDGTSNVNYIGMSSSGFSFAGNVQILNGATAIGFFAVADIASVTASGGRTWETSPQIISTIDAPSAGTQSYSIQCSIAGGSSMSFEYIKLIAYEL